jgi:hypothetical protein
MPMPRHNQPAVVLADVKPTPSVAAARPALTSSARVGVGEMPSERKKAAGGVEPKKFRSTVDGRRLGPARARQPKLALAVGAKMRGDTHNEVRE